MVRSRRIPQRVPSPKRSFSRFRLLQCWGVFRIFTGIPTIPDNIGDANPRGLALKFTVPGDGEVDIVLHSFDGFPVKTAAEFAQLLVAIGASGKDAPKPTTLDKYLASHPVAKTFLTTQKPPPVSFATTAFFGVNSFEFTNTQGQSTHIRYRVMPVAGEQYLDAAALKARDANYLQDEIKERLAKRPVGFIWYAQIAEKGDIIDDPLHRLADNAQAGQIGHCDDNWPRTRRGECRQANVVFAGECARRHANSRSNA